MAKILVVDDRAMNRQFLTTLLSYGDHKLLEAADGKEALEITRAEHPDLVITDLLMPTMNGFEFAQAVRADPAITPTKIIFYTATYRVSEARTLADACGVSIVIPKPSEPQLILNTIHEVLGIAPSSTASKGKGDKDEALPAEAERRSVALITDRLSEYMSDLQGLNKLMAEIVQRGKELGFEKDRLVTLSEKLFKSLSGLQNLTSRMAAIIEIGLDLIAQRDPQELMKIFCAGAQDIIPAEYTVLGVLDNTGESLRYLFAKGMADDMGAKIKSQLPLTGIFGELISKRRPRRINDLSGDPQKAGLPAWHPPVHSFLGVPIVSPSQVYGWLYLANAPGEKGFSEDDERLASTIGAQAALGYEHVMLYDEVQRHAAQLQLEINERKHAEETLKKKVSELEQFIEVTVGRENLMVDLKNEVNTLKRELGRPEPYDISVKNAL